MLFTTMNGKIFTEEELDGLTPHDVELLGIRLMQEENS